ncbi:MULTISPECIES: hypothetical protein [unclassified Agrococcus]|uniref:hypothetical protein n=1 Tax=unclassified Agrococcus TaxID=2615065 RepID=UPI00361D7D6D
MTLRRTIAVGLVALASATLVGCIQLPVGAAPTSPATSPTTSAPATSEPASSAPASEPASSEPTTPDAGGLGPFTVDDGVGDTWTYTVTGYELPATLESGTVPDGMVAVALLLDATHDEGTASWGICFEVTFTGSQGTYSVADEASQSVVAVNDVYLSVSESFTEGRAVVVVPAAEAVPGASFTVTSVYGSSSETFPLE